MLNSWAYFLNGNVVIAWRICHSPIYACAFITSLPLTTVTYPFARDHRRRIKTEEKAKVVPAVWGTEFIQFLAALAVLDQDDMKIRMNCTRMIWKKGLILLLYATPHLTAHSKRLHIWMCNKSKITFSLLLPLVFNSHKQHKFTQSVRLPRHVFE